LLTLFIFFGSLTFGNGTEPAKVKPANYFPAMHKNTAYGQAFCHEIKKGVNE
jgi:hypothetical protein